MNFKKCSFISLVSIFTLLLFEIFSNTHAINYRFDTNCDSQNLNNKSLCSISLNLTEGYSSYLRLNPFVLNIKFNNSLFDFKGITISKNIRKRDIITENSGNTVKIVFNPIEPRLIPFSNNFAEIFKADFVCKSDINCCHSYFQTDVTDSNTEERLVSKFIDVTVRNDTQNISKNNNTAEKYFSNSSSKDCHLKSIIPNIGSLNPSFNPQILKYKMEVPKEVQEVYFDIVPISENTEVKVSKHRLGAPGTITYINITSKNKSGSLSYLIEVKRSTKSWETQENGKFDFKSSYKAEARGKIKNMKSKRNKHKNGRKNSNDNSYEESDADENEDDNQETSENNDGSNGDSNASSPLRNNKIYWTFAFVVLILSIAVYLFLKKKSQSSNNKSVSENDINNSFEK